jgi:hypothetical protein
MFVLKFKFRDAQKAPLMTVTHKNEKRKKKKERKNKRKKKKGRVHQNKPINHNQT